MRGVVSAVVATVVGLLVLAGFFLRVEILASLQSVLLGWAVILAAIALLVGIANLFYVHWRKVIAGQWAGIYSAALIFSFIITAGVVGWFGPGHPFSLWIFNNIQLPVESSLVAILAVLLVYAAARLLRRRNDSLSVIFTLTVFLVLLATAPIFGIDAPTLNELRAWIAQVPAVGGARGILLGVALGIIATGMRILAGSDRPYGG